MSVHAPLRVRVLPRADPALVMDDWPFYDPEAAAAFPVWETYCPVADKAGTDHGEHGMGDLCCHECGEPLWVRRVDHMTVLVPISEVPLASDLPEPFEHPDLTSFVREEWPTLDAWVRYLDDTRGLTGTVYELAEPAAWRRLERRLRRADRRAS